MATISQAENEIFENIEKIDIQDKVWAKEIIDIMEKCDIEYYPELKHFIKCGKNILYKEISTWASQQYMADIMEVESFKQWKIKHGIFDVMDICGIQFFPDEIEQYKYAKKMNIYKMILKYSSLEEERKILKLSTKLQYEKIIGRKILLQRSKK